uniref:CA domain-containing protein n=1 Tax=Angiostrongylus cantonensis TaxID=6313 RepID=A0A0K0CXR9_ANGCA
MKRQAINNPQVYKLDKKPNFQNGAILYSLISSHPPCPLMVQPMTGQLQLTETLDFEKIKTYRIRIKAQDQGIPPRSANMTLIIHVSDFNDNPPVFENTTYEAEVAENSVPMTAVLQVKAHDADSRENGEVLYRVTNGSSLDANLFVSCQTSGGEVAAYMEDLSFAYLLSRAAFVV